MSSWHLSFGLSREMWGEMLRSALPVRVSEGSFDVVSQARGAIGQLEVGRRVAGLLEDQSAPKVVRRAGKRALRVWDRNKPVVYEQLGRVIQIQGTWRVDVDDLGTELRYGPQRVTADAAVKGVAEGTIRLLDQNLEFPFLIEKRVAASVALGQIRYDKGDQAILGNVQDLAVHLGDNAVLQLLSRLAEYALEQQVVGMNPITLLQKAQVSELVGPMGGALKLRMGVEDLALDIDDDQMTLKVRFGFSQAQLTDDLER
jgi:hypothetical protein